MPPLLNSARLENLEAQCHWNETCRYTGTLLLYLNSTGLLNQLELTLVDFFFVKPF